MIDPCKFFTAVLGAMMTATTALGAASHRFGWYLLVVAATAGEASAAAAAAAAAVEPADTARLGGGGGGSVRGDYEEELQRQRRPRRLRQDVVVPDGEGTARDGWRMTAETSTEVTTTTSSSRLLDGSNNNSTSTAFNFSFQPRVTVVEGLQSRCGIASISNPAGTPWCQGAPTYWVTGHQEDHEIPRCLINGSWIQSNTTVLNNTRDRHYCVTMDVNKDGFDDIICNVGAGRGRGMGYNELWMTDPLTGSVTQLLNASSDNPYASPSGLQKYPTMRNRIAATLKNSNGETKFVFMGTLGLPRSDGLPNQHRMFKNVYTAPDTFPYFVEVPGPWTQQLFPTNGAVAGDYTGDGVDDIVICNTKGTAVLARQVPSNETFVPVRGLPTNQPLLNNWIKSRLADVTGDSRKDLVVVAATSYTYWKPPWFVTVFRGIPTPPFFNFSTPYYRRQLSFAPMDVEVLDVNQDGKADIYVVLVNNTKGAYCGPQTQVIRLPPDVIPPIDTAHDLLLVGAVVNARLPQQRFQAVQMRHAQPGCGAIAQRWDDRTMLLSQGSFDNSGYQLLLNW